MGRRTCSQISFFNTNLTCNVNEPSLGWLGVDLLWALSADSDCVCLYDISLINELHYRVLMYRYLTDVAKNVTWCQEVLSNL